MTSQQLESRLALAMLPLGATMTIAAVAGFVSALVFAGQVALEAPDDAGWRLAWAAAAAAVALYVIRKGIETMCTFDWRVAVLPLLLAATIVGTSPAYW